MSIGCGAFCRLIAEDETIVIYEYSCTDVDRIGDMSEELHTYDGMIMVEKECFVKADISEKIKRRPSGRKVKVVRRIINNVDVSQYLRDRKIKVENCKACTHFIEVDDKGLKVGRLLYRLLFVIFERYQEEQDCIPQKAGYFC